MSHDSQSYITLPYKWPLDPTLLVLGEQETSFFKSLTGIRDNEELRKHIIQVQTKAYEVYCCPCVHGFAFTALKIARHPAYERALQLPQTRSNAILLDIGCLLGSDLRKAVFDGWPIENVIGSDIQPALWDCGHDLFKSTPKSFPAAFIPGDAFSSTIIEPREPFYSKTDTPRPSDLRTLKSLTPLQGHISAIYAASFFHVFSEESQLLLAKQLATLLSPEPGSIIFGSDGGNSVKLLKAEVNTAPGRFILLHSPESWKDLWDGRVFKKGSVKVEANLTERERKAGDPPPTITHWLDWSVTRL